MGLGKILAQGQLAAEKERIAHGGSVACPLCGREMEYNGMGWFCYGGPPHQTECSAKADILRKCRAADETELVDPISDLDPVQGQTIACVLDTEQKPRVWFETVRGGRGCTNLRVSADDQNTPDDTAIPALISHHGWTWAEWSKQR